MNALIYDIEIIKAVPDRKFPTEEGIDYCSGWQDHANMGISVIGAYHYPSNRVRVFCKDNFNDFITLCTESELLVSFNGIGFDNKVISAVLRSDIGSYSTKILSYDILRELWMGAGLGPDFSYPSHTGFSLGATAVANFGGSKTGHGALAPVDWQRKRFGSVIDYCLNDIALTKRLFERIRQIGGLRDPRDSSRFITMRRP